MQNFKIRASQLSKIMSNAKVKGELSAGCTTYLKDWYAEKMFGERDEIRSKYLDKGNWCENEAIEEVGNYLNIFGICKNNTFYENDYITGTPDVVESDFIIDTKCSWDGKTFLDTVTSEINKDYWYQLQSYMILTGLSKAKLAYVLLDTPSDVNFGIEVIYSNIPIENRICINDIDLDLELENLIKEKVLKCREWLINYDSLIKSNLTQKIQS